MSDIGQFVAGVAQGINASLTFGAVGAPQTSDSVASLNGQVLGSSMVTGGGIVYATNGGGDLAAGLLATPETGPLGVAASAAGVVEIAVGTAAVKGGVANLGAISQAMSSKETGSYTNTHESGKTYDGKGDKARSQESGKRVEKETGDKHVSTDWKPAENDREAFKDESRRLDSHGGPQSDSNHNKRQSPGKKYRKQDGSH